MCHVKTFSQLIRDFAMLFKQAQQLSSIYSQSKIFRREKNDANLLNDDIQQSLIIYNLIYGLQGLILLRKEYNDLTIHS